MNKKVDEVGNIYGRLTVLEEVKEDSKAGTYWRCFCECGKLHVVRGAHLRSGKIISCGCFRKECSERTLTAEIGNVYGRWTVLSYRGRTKQGTPVWICRCECGTERCVSESNLHWGLSKSCGCIAHEISYKDEAGNTYGDLLVLEDAGRDKYGASLWCCVCSCGNRITTRGSSLRSGNTKSCGCLQKSVASRIITKHNKSCRKIPVSIYPEEWNSSFRKSIRRRDNYMCMICSVTQSEYGRKLSVHHIDYDKRNTTKENCISLCGACHGKTNHNRGAWIKYFEEIMGEKYGE